MTAIYTFGPFRLDAEAGILFRGGDPVALGRRGVALLRVLAERPGMPASKDALIEAAWPGQVVEESNLSVQIAAVRRVLGEEREGGNWIETLPGRGYRYIGPVVTSDRGEAASTPSAMERPSIAVLPFQNMSGDPEQEYFADGMVDEIITSLSRIKWLIVTSRTSTFAFKGQNADIRDIARKLNVRYVLEGSVRKDAKRIRIIGQLIDAASGAHIWADRVDGMLDDTFELQDRITECVVVAIERKLRYAEIERARRKRPESMDAYDCYLRALPASYRPTPENSLEAVRLLERGFAIDPNYPPANVIGAWLYFYRVAATWSAFPDEDRALAVRLARNAIDNDADDPFVLALGGFLLASMGRDVEVGVSATKRAVELSPYSATVLGHAGWALTFTGNQDRAIGYFEAAIRLSASDPQIYRVLTGAAAASVLAGRFTEAVAFGEEARGHYAGWGPTHRFLAAAYAQLGETEKAAEALSNLFRLEPTVTVSHLRSFLPYQDGEQAERLWAGLRKAGMPE